MGSPFVFIGGGGITGAAAGAFRTGSKPFSPMGGLVGGLIGAASGAEGTALGGLAGGLLGGAIHGGAHTVLAMGRGGLAGIVGGFVNEVAGAAIDKINGDCNCNGK